MNENENTYEQHHFRKTADGELITVTELNTKITYTATHEYRIWRFVIVRERVRIRKTAVARVRYFLHNNRVSRFKRAVVPATKQFMADHGLQIYIAQ